MMRFFILLFLLVQMMPLFGQFSDDFSDGNLENPNWQGDLGHFTVNSDGQLQLNAPQAGTSMLALEETIPDSAVWSLWLKMDFAPSESNRLQVFLWSSSADLMGDALFLSLGENGNDDAIRIVQRISGVETELTGTAVGTIADAPELAIRLEKLGVKWGLFVDYSGGHSLQPVANWEHSISDSGYFGILCKYTASRKDKFYFDDMALSVWLPDTESPQLLGAQAENAHQVVVTFNEPLAPVMQAANFSLSGNVQVTAADFVAGDSTKILLELSPDLVNGQTYTVSAQNIKDKSGNVGGGNVSFSYLVPEVVEPFDIIINEVFPDPSPSVGLPESEFIELFNRSDKVLSLEGLSLQVNTSHRDLPVYNLLPGSYVVLVDEADTSLWSGFDFVLGLDLPGLSNSGATLSLSSGTNVIHQIAYNKHSYRNRNKEDGGWSLELVNPENPCLGELNWLVSSDLQGGTPGEVNSVLDKSFHHDALVFAQAYPVSPTQIALYFDQSLATDAVDIDYYSLTPSVAILEANLDGKVVYLNLAESLESGVIYEVSVLAGLSNCVEQAAGAKQAIRIGLPESPQKGDIVINEILFNPVPGGSDYVELFNVSNKIFNIKNLSLANLDKDNAIKTITSSALLFPRQYVALTPNRFQVESQYEPPDTAWIVENALPGLDDNQGNVSVLFNGQVLDSVRYDKEMHSRFLSDASGVALERISPVAASTGRSNWISGVSQTHYGTPGYQNAQYTVAPISGTDYVRVAQKVFSPNGDGFEDFGLFYYELPASGYSLNAQIFTADGQLVYRLVNDELVGAQGQIRWDGLDEGGNRVPGGIYVVRFEFFRGDGDKIVELESCGVVWP